METRAAALRIALGELDELVATLEDNDIHGEHLDRLLTMTRRELTERLRGVELQLWTLNGLPEVPRGRP